VFMLLSAGLVLRSRLSSPHFDATEARRLFISYIREALDSPMLKLSVRKRDAKNMVRFEMEECFAVVTVEEK
jgi:hypothetical protein